MAMQNPKFVDVDGIKTRYFAAGKGHPFVLIHGGHFGNTYNAYHWSLNFDGLSANFHVHAVDKLGQGYTDNPKNDADYTMAKTIEHVYRFLGAVGINRAILMGHSRGALPAARIAVDHPEMVRALIIVDSNTLAADHPSSPANFYNKLEENAPAVADEEYVRREPEANSYSNEHITPDFVAEMVKIARLPKIIEAKQRAGRLMVSQFLPDVQKRKYETLDMIRAGRLQAPTLVLWGLNDPSAPVVLGHELFQHVARAVPKSQFHVFNRAGHYVFREHAAEFNRVIANFLADALPT
jgi:2-hydroxy-6-oxo-6-(2'-carboxyphenyl)-hexa-2,4-dienoate hydrolase